MPWARKKSKKASACARLCRVTTAIAWKAMPCSRSCCRPCMTRAWLPLPLRVWRCRSCSSAGPSTLTPTRTACCWNRRHQSASISVALVCSRMGHARCPAQHLLDDVEGLSVEVDRHGQRLARVPDHGELLASQAVVEQPLRRLPHGVQRHARRVVAIGQIAVVAIQVAEGRGLQDQQARARCGDDVEPVRRVRGHQRCDATPEPVDRGFNHCASWPSCSSSASCSTGRPGRSAWAQRHRRWPGR